MAEARPEGVASHDTQVSPESASASRRETGVNPARWSIFLRHHAPAVVACDFCAAVTLSFRALYVFMMIEHASWTILHTNITAHPTAAWTLQQSREAIPSDHPYRFLIHDRYGIFSQALDQSIHHLGLRVLKTPPRTPQANAIRERAIGSLRRGCLDFLIPLSENQLRRQIHRHRLPANVCVVAQPVLESLHHDYAIEKSDP